MAICCISDIHGCYTELMILLEQAGFNPGQDTLYVLGDVVDRGDNHIECLKFIMRTKNVHLLIGNHEQMMLDYFAGKDRYEYWFLNGGRGTLAELEKVPAEERDRIISYIRSRPYYKTIGVNGVRYFLSHAGIDPTVPFKYQSKEVLTWSREEFYSCKALPKHICIFGHTQTYHINQGRNCCVWFDRTHKDKINIDCGCAYGGALALLRLDDGEIFYIKSERGRAHRYVLCAEPVPAPFFSRPECNV